MTESIGAKLKQARKEKNLSLDEVYQKTKIHINALKALEEDNPGAIGITYAKGFLKLYAKFLGLDLNEINKIYEKKFPSEPKGFIKNQESQQKPSPEIKLRPSLSGLIIKITVLIIAVAIVFSSLMFVAAKWKKRTSQKESKKSAGTLRIATVKSSSAATPKKLPSKINLVLRAKEDTWLQVTIDGDVTFRNILKKGQVETWTAKEKALLWVGNAGGLVLEVNGKLVSPLGRRGQVIKRIQITRESITIPK